MASTNSITVSSKKYIPFEVKVAIKQEMLFELHKKKQFKGK